MKKRKALEQIDRDRRKRRRHRFAVGFIHRRRARVYEFPRRPSDDPTPPAAPARQRLAA